MKCDSFGNNKVIQPLPATPSADRNQEAIYRALYPRFLAQSQVLELGSGTGQHGVYVSEREPSICWQCSDTEDKLDGMQAWVAAAHVPMPSPIVLDVVALDNEPYLNAQAYDLVFTANTLHFVSSEIAASLVKCAAKALLYGGYFAVYGPFNDDGEFTSEGNRGLQDWLEARDPKSGIKDFQWLDKVASQAGFDWYEQVPLPSNNFIRIYKKN